MTNNADYNNESVFFDWEPFNALGYRTAVWVDSGVSANSQFQSSFYLKVADALRNCPFKVIVTAQPDAIEHWPNNFIVTENIRTTDVLPHVHAVISQGNYLTVCETLLEGLPQVLIPLSQAQQYLADWIISQNAGLKLNFNRFKPNHLENAVLELLNNIDFRKSAERTGKLFVAPVGVTYAAGLLEQLSHIRKQEETDKINSTFGLVKSANMQ